MNIPEYNNNLQHLNNKFCYVNALTTILKHLKIDMETRYHATFDRTKQIWINK